MLTRVDGYGMYLDTVLQQIFTVIKTGKKYEKLFFLGGAGGGGGGGCEKKTLFGILEIQFLEISHCSRF